MNTTDLLLIMLGLLSENDERLTEAEVPARYCRFFDAELGADVAGQGVRELVDAGYIARSGDVLDVTEAGVKDAYKRHVDYYYETGVAVGRESEAERAYQASKGVGLDNDSMVDLPQLEHLKAQLSRHPGTLVDLGCGKGGLTSHFETELRRKTVGIDKSEGMIEIAKTKNGRVTWLVGDLNDFAHLDLREVGAFLLVDSLYFCQDLDASLVALDGMLAPGG